MTRFAATLLILSVFGTAGCRTAQRISSQLSAGVPSRLTGVWTIVASETRKRSGTLELRSNGAFVANDLPEDVLDDADAASAEFVSGSGDWSYLRDADPQRVVLVFQQLQGVDHAVPARAELQLEQEQQSPVLTFHVGDPDEDERVALQMTDAGEGTAR